MKRFLAIIIAFSILMGMLISCDIFTPVENSTTSSTPGSTSSTAGGGTSSSSSTTTTTATESSTTSGGGSSDLQGAVEVTEIGYAFETIYFEWLPYESVTEYNVYCDGKAVDAELKKYILAKIEERKEAKKAKDFAKADAIRAELLEKGVQIKDTREGTVWELV